MAEITIAELKIDTEALVENATLTRRKLDLLKKSQKELENQGKRNTDAFTQNEIAIKGLSTSYNQQKKVLTQLTDENNKLISSEKALTNALNKENTTIEKTRNNNKELLSIRSKLNVSTEQGQKRLAQINLKLDENNKFIKENVSQYEKQKIGIGDYEGAIRKVFPAGGELMNVLKQIKGGLVAQKVAMQSSTVATNGTSKALKFFKIALISTGIGAIVVLLGSLVAAFQSTQFGADAITKALAPIKGAFEGIIGVVQNISLNVFSQLGDRFTIVSNGILNGIDKIRIGWNKLSGDTEEAEMLQARVIERVKEIDQAQLNLNKTTDELNGIWRDAAGNIKDASDAQKEIAALQIEIENAENKLIISRSKSNRIIYEQNKISKDTSKTIKEREAALKNALNESAKILKADQEIIDLKIKQQKLENSKNDTDREAEKQLAILQGQRNDKATEQIKLQTRLEIELTNIRKKGAVADIPTVEPVADVKDDSEKENAELEKIRNFENRKRELLNQIALENATSEEEKATIKAEQDFEKEALALENLKLNAEQRTELEALLLTNQEQVKQDIIANFAEKNQKLNEDSNKKIIQSEKKTADERVKVAQYLTNMLTGFLGDSLGAKLAAIGIDAAIQIGLLKVAAASSSARVGVNTASAVSSAVAASPLTGGLPFVAPIVASGVANKSAVASSTASGISGILGASALKGLGTLATTKFEQGGIIGGNRHSSGGTKFYGEDGTTFEAERGEYIGVMSRDATSKFMEFNNTYTPGSALTNSMRLGNKFADGGIINPIQNSVSEKINPVNIAEEIASKINDIKIVTVVEDITELQGIQSEVINGATF